MLNDFPVISNSLTVDQSKGLKYFFMDELDDQLEPPSELVQGLLLSRSVSLIFGPSNTGKTFIAVDLACAIARGVDWFGRKTEQGLVIYIAAESPNSVKTRCKAYQAYHQCELKNLAIVDSPVNLFADPFIVQRTIDLVKQIECERGSKVRLIVGDTLANLTVGANENSGQDMSLVMENVKQISSVVDAHLMLVHHSGKSTSAKARGWSGVHASVDSEIEIVSSKQKSALHITKQRDLDSKGEKIGFALKRVEVGKSNFGQSISTCVVEADYLPPSEEKNVFRLGAIENRIHSFIRSHPKQATRADVKSMMGRHPRQSIERAIRSLIEKELIEERDGFLLNNEKIFLSRGLSHHHQ